MISINIEGLDSLLNKWRYISRTGLRNEMQQVAQEFGPFLEEAVKAKAPVDTGGYRSRITAQVRGMTVTVSSPDEFANRLEYGFIGTDSLGRHYAQPPQPHFRPAGAEISPQYVERVKAVIRETIA